MLVNFDRTKLLLLFLYYSSAQQRICHFKIKLVGWMADFVQYYGLLFDITVITIISLLSQKIVEMVM